MDSVSVRLTAADQANLLAVAEALRTDRDPFVTRSDAVKIALSAAAKDTAWLMRAAAGATTADTEAQR